MQLSVNTYNSCLDQYFCLFFSFPNSAFLSVSVFLRTSQSLSVSLCLSMSLSVSLSFCLCLSFSSSSRSWSYASCSVQVGCTYSLCLFYPSLFLSSSSALCLSFFDTILCLQKNKCCPYGFHD